MKNVNFKVLKCLAKGFYNFRKNIFNWIILVILLLFSVFSSLAMLIENNKNKIKIDKIEIDCELPLEDSSYTDIELAIMPYDLALQYDKRNYWEIYLGKVKYNHLIWFTFIIKEYGNNIFLKLIMLIFFLVMLLFVNLLLFSDRNFHNIYIKKGKYEFLIEIPAALVTTLICLLINMFIRIILTDKKSKEKAFEAINNISSINETNVEMKITSNKSNTKIIIFSIIGLLFIIFNFIYLISFGGIFINSQKFLLIRTLYSLIITFIIPFIFSLCYAFLIKIFKPIEENKKIISF